MSDHTHIEWTDATWQPITGCSIVSPGCTNCYAMGLAGTRLKHHPSRVGLTREVNGHHVWTGDVRLNEQWLTQPLKWTRPRRIFVCAHGDLFHEAVPDEWIDRVFAVMATANRHTYQILTKRADRMRRYLSSFHDDGNGFVTRDGVDGYMPGVRTFNPNRWPLPNVWLGVSAEDQRRADERIPDLLATPAAVRFVSAEPLLGPIDMAPFVDGPRLFDKLAQMLGTSGAINHDPCTKTSLDWIIVGGESGPNARPMHSHWARSIRDQCVSADVAYFFKQWGEYLPVGQTLPGCGKVHGATAVKPGRMKLHYGGTADHVPHHAFVDHGVEIASTDYGCLTFRVGKTRAGRLLDGREWNEMPGSMSQADAFEIDRSALLASRPRVEG